MFHSNLDGTFADAVRALRLGGACVVFRKLQGKEFCMRRCLPGNDVPGKFVPGASAQDCSPGWNPVTFPDCHPICKESQEG